MSSVSGTLIALACCFCAVSAYVTNAGQAKTTSSPGPRKAEARYPIDMSAPGLAATMSGVRPCAAASAACSSPESG